MRSASLLVLLALPLACGSSSDNTLPIDTGDGGNGTLPDGAPANPDGGNGTLPDGAPANPDATLPDGAVGDSVTTDFAFVGCNRLQKADWVQQQNPSSANTVQLKQTFADVAATTKGRFFMAGDLVLGLDANVNTLAGELAGWKTLYDADPNAKTLKLVPLPGNHEMLYKSGGVEANNAAADGTWSTWVTTTGFAAGSNGPTPSGKNPDALNDDQSKLSYSFDEGDVHYVLLNTDTLSTSQGTIGWIPLAWLTADLAAAQAKASVKSIFILGHKPILAPSGSTAGADAIEPSLVSKLETLLDTTTKVKGYLCAHAHTWDARKLPGNRGVYQIVAGNGGSQPEGAWAKPYYGITEVRVYASGKVGVVDHRRPVPTPYNGSPASAAVAQPEMQISP